MATTTTSKKRSANTKTTKKPAKTAAAAAKKASNKSVSKKAAPKAAVKATAKTVAKTEKVVEKKAVVKKLRTPRTPRILTAAVLRRWHIISATLFAIAAAAVAYFVKESTYQITLPHVTQNDLASSAQTVFAPAAHVMLDVDVRWYLVAVLVISAAFSLARATRLKVTEQRSLETRVSVWRWVDFAVTFGALVGLVAMFVGIQDYVAVKMMAIGVAASYFFAWLAERDNNTADAKRFGVSGVIAGLLPWFFIVTAMYGTYLYGFVRLPWYAYVTAAVVLIGQYLIARNQRLAARAANYLIVERNYIALNLLTKLAVATIIIIGLAS